MRMSSMTISDICILKKQVPIWVAHLFFLALLLHDPSVTKTEKKNWYKLRGSPLSHLHQKYDIASLTCYIYIITDPFFFVSNLLNADADVSSRLFFLVLTYMHTFLNQWETK